MCYSVNLNCLNILETASFLVEYWDNHSIIQMLEPNIYLSKKNDTNLYRFRWADRNCTGPFPERSLFLIFWTLELYLIKETNVPLYIMGSLEVFKESKYKK